MRFDPTQVPTFPVEIGGELPASTVYVPGISLRDLGGIFPPLVAQSLATIAGSSYGPALTSNSTGTTSTTGAQVVVGNYLGNIGQEVTIFWAGDQNASPPGGGSVIFGIEYDANGDAPYHTLSLALDGGANIQAICGIGANYYQFVSSGAWIAQSRASWVGTIQIGGSISLYQSGALLGTTTGLPTGTFATTSTSTLRLGNYYPNGYSNANNAVAGFYNGIWTPTQIAQFNAEPFAMLRPVRRRTYYAQPSTGATFSASIRAPRALASVQFSAGESQTVAAAAKQALASIAAAAGTGLTLAATERKITAAESLTASDGLTAAGSLQETSAAISALSSLGLTLAALADHPTADISLSVQGGADVMALASAVTRAIASISASTSQAFTAAPAAHPARAAISAEASAALALAAALDEASAAIDLSIAGGVNILALAARVSRAIAAVSASSSQTISAAPIADPAKSEIVLDVVGQADVMAIAASVGRAIAAIYAPLAVTSGRSVAFLPSIRAVSFITSARAVYFSPRVIGDAEPFTADIASVLLAGETLTALPSVTCITGDLTVGAPSVSGTAITFGISGAGTIGALSEITITIETSNGRTLNLAARVLTTPFIAGLPNPDLGLLAVPSPLFSDTRSENADEYEIDLTEWLADNEVIISQSVACITGDLTISGAAAVGAIVQWQASGPGTPGAISGFLITVTTTQRGPVGFYCGVLTD